MGHLSALLKKNYILWKRNCFCSTCELILPVLLIFALMGIRSAVEKEDVQEQSFLTKVVGTEPVRGIDLPQEIYPAVNETQLEMLATMMLTDKIKKNEFCSNDETVTPLMSFTLAQKLDCLSTSDRLMILPRIKNCNDNVYRDRKWKNGQVALGPQGHPIVAQLDKIFKDYYRYETKYFESNQEIDDYVSSSKYGMVDSQGVNSSLLCFGVMFDDTSNNGNYTYSLRFNSSFNGQNNEIPPTFLEEVDPIKLEDQGLMNLYWSSGMLTVQNFIDNMIVQIEAQQDALLLNPQFTYVRRAVGVKDEFATFLRGGFGVYLILPLMIIYLRMTYALMYEKEKKLREGMKMMGLQNTSFYLSWIIQYFVVYTLISIIATILLKAVVFPNTDGFVLFINYWLFCMVLIVQSMFISVFFTRALFGLIVAIVWYLMMYLVISLVGSGGGALIPEATYWGASISSHAAFSFSFDVMVLFEAQGTGVTVAKMGTKIENYSVNIAIAMHIINIFFYGFMFIYLDLVFPNEWGKKKHPLFCIPYFNKPHNVEEIQRKMSNQIHKEMYEDVDQALLDQETHNECVKISNLSKIYPNGKSAVKNVNLSMYQGQIYALLGHNGAGKTSTISMLTGLLDISTGSAKAYGFDVETQIDEIRQFMGVCPQHDILFDNLTVKEHLEMFATFKGMKAEDIPPAVRRMIEDVDLLEKTDYLTKNLSGGQKRRLSVAIAFIGNSKLIYLDEPTSGMDTSARRYIWEMLKNYKEDRIIVLTTHFMDEADFLGDRIGIMGEGKLICSGSSVFLKNHFGSGYNLTIVKENTNIASEPIIQLIKTQCSEATIVSNVSAEIIVQLPMIAIKKFPALFEALDQGLAKLQMLSYGISITTLEEVFLKVSQIEAGHQQVGDFQNQEHGDAQMVKIDDFDMNQIRITSSSVLFVNHTIALLIKRARNFKRDMRSLCCEIFLPCLVVLCGLALMTIEFISEANVITLIPNELFSFTPKYYMAGDQTQVSKYQPYFTQFDVMDLKTTNTQIDVVDMDYFNEFDLRSNIGWYFIKPSNGKSVDYMMLSNSVFRQGPLVQLNQMNQAVYQYLTKDRPNFKPSITVINQPFRRTNEEKNGNNVVSGFLAALVFSIGMSFIPASVIAYIVKEREINIKHQQLVSGVSVKAYWFSNWIMDVGKHIVPSIICALLILAFNIETLIEDGNYGAMWLLFFLYGWAIIPFCYLFSYAFKLQGNAMLLNFFLHLMTGSIISLVIYILRLIPSTRAGAKGAHWFLRFIPSFTFAYGILNISSKKQYQVIEGYGTVKDTYDMDIAGADVLYLALTGLLYIILVFVIEYFEDSGSIQKLGSNEESIPYVPKQQDSDVWKENELCETYNPEDKAILVKGLRKVFMLPDNVHKVAVDKVSFAIDSGEVFGLLGVNGAGKTTTFKILSGEIKPTSGLAWVAGKNVITDLEAARSNVGYCPQFDALLENLTVREHLELFSDIKGIPHRLKTELVNKKLQEMDLVRFEHIQSGQLSGGNKRKLSVAIAMIGNPPIVFLDEPSTGMDPEARRFMWNVISRIATQRKQSTIILTTHSMEEAEALCTKLAIQVEGNLRCLGSVQHIKSKYGKGYEIEVKMEKPKHEEVQELVKKMSVQSSRLNNEQTSQILKDLNQGFLEAQISMKGYGSHIYNDLRKPNGLSIETLAEFVLIEGMGIKLMQFIGESLGQFEIIEHFQSFYRFRLNSAITVGKLFAQFEQLKPTLRISQYSIKQASIEQIFNNFAIQSNQEQAARHQQQQDVKIRVPSPGDQELIPLGTGKQ